MNTTHAGEYLLFGIGEEQYGIDILKVKEIRSYTEPTRMANAPAHYKGIIDLRGQIIPIIDARIKFNLDKVIYNDTTVVIVITVTNADIGLVVDTVNEVVTYDAEEIQDAPKLDNDVSSVIGIGSKQDCKMAILIDAVLFMNDIKS